MLCHSFNGYVLWNSVHAPSTQPVVASILYEEKIQIFIGKTVNIPSLKNNFNANNMENITKINESLNFFWTNRTIRVAANSEWSNMNSILTFRISSSAEIWRSNVIFRSMYMSPTCTNETAVCAQRKGKACVSINYKCQTKQKTNLIDVASFILSFRTVLQHSVSCTLFLFRQSVKVYK